MYEETCSDELPVASLKRASAATSTPGTAIFDSRPTSDAASSQLMCVATTDAVSGALSCSSSSRIMPSKLPTISVVCTRPNGGRCGAVPKSFFQNELLLAGAIAASLSQDLNSYRLLIRTLMSTSG